MIPAYSLAEIAKHNPCPERWRKVKALKLGEGKITAKEAIEAGVTFDDLVWVASSLAQTDKDVEHRFRLWLTDVTAHVLHIFEKERPTDLRPREAIITNRQFARGKIKATAMIATMAAARNASRDVAVKGAAAREAAWAAGVGWYWDSARAAARSAERAAVGAAEQSWQAERLVYWFSEESPTDWPLPPNPKPSSPAKSVDQ